MFVEPRIQFEGKNKAGSGWIEVVCGSMFSGKTEELIRRLNRALIARQKVEIFKPAVDKRYDIENVVSHNKTVIRSTPVEFAGDILLLAGDCEVVGIDEAQFFDEGLIEVSNKLADSGKRVIIAGLDMDYLGNPFSPINELMAMAEYVNKMHAICVKCGNPAAYTYRLSESTQRVVLGEKDVYEARCRSCYNEGMNKKKDAKK